MKAAPLGTKALAKMCERLCGRRDSEGVARMGQATPDAAPQPGPCRERASASPISPLTAQEALSVDTSEDQMEMEEKGTFL